MRSILLLPWLLTGLLALTACGRVSENRGTRILRISPGKKIAIVGPTGAGKTTMVNLLMKFYEINSVDILID